MNQLSGEATVDRDNLLENLSGDRELLLEVLGIFASEARHMFSAVRDAAKCNDAASPTGPVRPGRLRQETLP